MYVIQEIIFNRFITLTFFARDLSRTWPFHFCSFYSLNAIGCRPPSSNRQPFEKLVLKSGGAMKTPSNRRYYSSIHAWNSIMCVYSIRCLDGMFLTFCICFRLLFHGIFKKINKIDPNTHSKCEWKEEEKTKFASFYAVYGRCWLFMHSSSVGQLRLWSPFGE